MRRPLVALAALILIAALAAVRLWPRRGAHVVRIAYAPILASLPLFVAQEQNLFPREKIRVRPLSFSSSNDMVNALIAGQADVLPAVSLIPIVHLEIQHPGRVRIFSHSHMSRQNALDKVLVRDDSSIRSLKDLVGKKVGVFPGTAAARMFGAFLKKHAVDAQAVTFVQLPPAAQLSALESGVVDALFSYEPVTTTALVTGRYRELFGSVYADLLDPCPIGVSAISRDFEKRHPELAQKTARVLLEAVSFAAAHPADARALLPRFTRIAPEIAARVNIADTTLSEQVDAANIQRFIDLLYESGEIPERIDARRLVAPTQ
jgi:NitT/TauT family transport system substrate-binding protein